MPDDRGWNMLHEDLLVWSLVERWVDGEDDLRWFDGVPLSVLEWS